jgi:hypothetical protein
MFLLTLSSDVSSDDMVPVCYLSNRHLYHFQLHRLYPIWHRFVFNQCDLLLSAGMGICLDLSGSYLACATITGCLRLWDLSRREAKPHSYPKFLADHISDFGEVRNLQQQNLFMNNLTIFFLNKREGII